MIKKCEAWDLILTSHYASFITLLYLYCSDHPSRSVSDSLELKTRLSFGNLFENYGWLEILQSGILAAQQRLYASDLPNLCTESTYNHIDINMNESGKFGGSCDTACIALLDGKVTDPETEETSSFRIPLTKLPAILGRSHKTSNPNFFGLGRRKALSRKQCVIYYQDSKGGTVEWDTHALKYKEKGSWDFKKTTLKTPVDKLPEEGFFILECLGRNSITVNKQKVEQGESIVLESGSPIRISQHRLYFLLPTDAPPRKHLIQPTSSSNSAQKAKRRVSLDHSSPSAAKRPKGSGLQSYTESLETMSTQELLGMMTNAISVNAWDRKNQMVGTVVGTNNITICQNWVGYLDICLTLHLFYFFSSFSASFVSFISSSVLRAVKDAGRAHEIMELAKDNGVARNRVIDWIEKSGKYKQFVQQLQSKIEPRSYQAAMTKALVKAGYTRNGISGRYAKWHLPPIENGDDPVDEEAAEGNDNDQDEESQDEEDENEDAENKEDNDASMEETENNEVDEEEELVDEEEEDDDDDGDEEEKEVDEELNEMETEPAGGEEPEKEEGSETHHDESDVEEEEGTAENEDADETKGDMEEDKKETEEEKETKGASTEDKNSGDKTSKPELKDAKEEDIEPAEQEQPALESDEKESPAPSSEAAQSGTGDGS